MIGFKTYVGIIKIRCPSCKNEIRIDSKKIKIITEVNYYDFHKNPGKVAPKFKYLGNYVSYYSQLFHCPICKKVLLTKKDRVLSSGFIAGFEDENTPLNRIKNLAKTNPEIGVKAILLNKIIYDNTGIPQKCFDEAEIKGFSVIKEGTVLNKFKNLEQVLIKEEVNNEVINQSSDYENLDLTEVYCSKCGLITEVNPEKVVPEKIVISPFDLTKYFSVKQKCGDCKTINVKGYNIKSRFTNNLLYEITDEYLSKAYPKTKLVGYIKIKNYPKELIKSLKCFSELNDKDKIIKIKRIIDKYKDLLKLKQDSIINKTVFNKFEYEVKEYIKLLNLQPVELRNNFKTQEDFSKFLRALNAVKKKLSLQ